MAIATIDIFSVSKKVQKEVKTKHYWYDYDKKELKVIEGGQLSFEYNNGQMIPKGLPLYQIGYEPKSNREMITKWLRDNDDLDLDVVDDDGRIITVSFPDEAKEAVEDSLYSNRFSYEIQ